MLGYQKPATDRAQGLPPGCKQALGGLQLFQDEQVVRETSWSRKPPYTPRLQVHVAFPHNTV